MLKPPSNDSPPSLRAVLTPCLAAVFYLLPHQLSSQVSSRPPAPQFSLVQLRFSPINSAARAAGLGGAFIGVANDATTTAINPAGAAFLTRPEISLSQAWGRDARDFPAPANTEPRETRLHFNSTLVNIVYPFRGFTFALYRQLVFYAAFDFTREQFLASATARPLTLHEQLGASGNFPGLRSEFAMEVWQDAFVVAKTLAHGVRMGATLRMVQLRFNLHERHYFAPELWLASRFEAGAIGPNSPSGLYRIYHGRQEEFRPAWNFGVLLELNPRLTLGAVYHRLPKYDIDQSLTLPAYTLPDRTPLDANDETLRFEAEEREASFQLDLPDNFGVGLAWKPGKRNLVALDAVWHRSRTLLRGLEKNLSQDDVVDNAGAYSDPDGREDWTSANVLALHAGLEHLFLAPQTMMPGRLGVYRAAVFGVRATANDANLQREYPATEQRWHATAGLGLIIKNFRFEMSLDFSAEYAEAIGSAVVSF
jgi:hypothetical protein